MGSKSRKAKRSRRSTRPGFEKKVNRIINAPNLIFQTTGTALAHSQGTQGFLIVNIGTGADIQTFLRSYPGDSTLPAANPEAYRLYIDDWVTSITMNLASSFPARVIVYPYVARRDIPIAETSLTNIFSDDLKDEQKATSGTLTPSVVGVTPFRSHRLCSYLKFGRPKQYKLKGTAQGTGRNGINLRLRLKNKKISRYTVSDNTGANLFLGRKGIFRGLMVRTVGFLANNNAGSSTGPTPPAMVFPGAHWNVCIIDKISIRESTEQMPRYSQSSAGMTASNAQLLQPVGITSVNNVGNWNSYPI